MNTGRHQINIAGSVIFGVTFVAPLIAIAATNSRLEGWRFLPDYQQLDFALSAPSQPKVFFLQQPPRLVVDLPNTKLGMVPTRQDYQGLVQRIRVSQLNATDTRIVMDLAPGSPFNPAQVQVQPLSTTQWVIRPFVNAYSNPQSQLLQTQPPNNQPYPPGVYPPQPPVNNSFDGFPGVYPPQPNGTPQRPINPYLPPNVPDVSENNFNNPNQNNPNQTPPMVVVPPIAPLNQTTGGFTNDSNLLPPALFPNQNGNWNNPPLINPNPSTYQQNPTTLEWGQQLPPASQ